MSAATCGRQSPGYRFAHPGYLLDLDVIAHFRRTGRGWQSRINAALRKVAKLPKEKQKSA